MTQTKWPHHKDKAINMNLDNKNMADDLRLTDVALNNVYDILQRCISKLNVDLQNRSNLMFSRDRKILGLQGS